MVNPLYLLIRCNMITDKAGLRAKVRRARQCAKFPVLQTERGGRGWDEREQFCRMEEIDASDGRAGVESQKNWLVPHLFFSPFTIFSFLVFQMS